MEKKFEKSFRIATEKKKRKTTKRIQTLFSNKKQKTGSDNRFSHRTTTSLK